ncbi:MAG: restriction endonuclease subunit S [Lachnospiraceae bacterium]|nr:restriction endonuclease subunit S [Lachnospiraceae bacterium]
MNAQDLKNSILQLAVCGKLVEQRAEEGNARELLEQIKLEKDQLIKDKKIKKSKPLPEITEDEIPFEIPESWAWVRVGEIGSLTRGSGIKRTEVIEDGYPCIRYGELYTTYRTKFEKTVSFVNKELFDKCHKICTGDVAMTLTGENKTDIAMAVTYEGKDTIAMGGDMTCWSHHMMNPLYLVYFINSPYAISCKRNLATGDIIIHISNDKLATILMPVPPLEEQHRIVAKIEEILPYIDQYDKAYMKLETFNKKFPEDMKKSILQMAMQGKLVEQRPEEGIADELYEQIVAEKAQLIKDGKVQKKKDTQPFYDNDELSEFDIPDSWKWVKLSDVSLIQEGAGIRKWQYRDIGTQILCVTNILEGSIDLDKKKLFISDEEYHEKYEHLTLNIGDIVTACSGGSWGKTAIFDSTRTMMLNTSTLRLRFYGDLAYNKYLYYITKSVFFRRQLELQLSGMQPNFGYAHYSRVMFPLPPLEEQKRIVAKIEELLLYCDQLIK